MRRRTATQPAAPARPPAVAQAGIPHSHGPIWTTPAILVLTTLAVYACAWLGYAFTTYPTHTVSLWPNSGLMLALLVLLPGRDWPAALAGSVLGNMGADLQHAATVTLALSGGAANTLESLVAAWLLVRLFGSGLELKNLREVSGLVLGAAILSNALTSLVGALFLHVGWHEAFWRGWVLWWTGDGLGMLVVAPLILTWAAMLRSRPRLSAATLLEAGLVLLATAVVAQALMRSPSPHGVLGSYPYMVFPLLIWSGVRFGSWGAATATAVLTAVIVWNATHAPGLFAHAAVPTLGQMIQIYGYLGLASFSSLVPAAALHEREAAQERLRESEGRFRQMADTIDEMFYVVDATWQPLYVSPAWTRIWRRPMSEAYDRHVWLDSVHPDDRPALDSDREAVMRGESTVTEFRVLRPDGSMRWVRGRSFPVRDETGRVYRMAGLSQDITRVREAEERAVEAQRMEAVGQLAGGVAHDFNNLLTVILSSTDMALAALPEAAPVRTDILAVRQAAESASRLTRQLLAFSRQQVLRPEVLRLNDLIARMGGMLGRLIGEKLRLKTSLDPDAGAIRADVGSMEQVLVNLVVNARDAMPDGGEVVVELRDVDVRDATGASGPSAHESAPPPGEYVMLAVSDTGAGMDEATRMRVFEPFFTTKAHGKGVGLGLATVYGIVQQSDGYITVRSEPGRGTTFRLYFPRVAGSAPLAATLDDAPPARGRESVLLVEDEDGVRTTLRRVLLETGYEVLEAADGPRALDLLASRPKPIHLLITDVVMPGMSGPELAERFAALHPHVPILFISGYAHGTMREVPSAAPTAYLQKPFSSRELAAQCRRLLDDATERPAST